MTKNTLLSRQISKLSVSASAFKSPSYLRYHFKDRLQLISAIWSAKKHRADLFDFRIHYLGESQFRYLLWEVFIRGTYFFKTDCATPLILDCGANIGMATLFFKRLYPDAYILSFEADPTTADILKTNVHRNRLEKVHVYNLMLSSDTGERSFYIDADEAGSLTMSADSVYLANHREIRVMADKLSNYIDTPVELLKLDIEGSEFDVMKELKDSGKLSHVKRMIIEYHHKIGSHPSRMGRFLSFLEEAGFEYQIAGECNHTTQSNTFQAVMIGAYRCDDSQ